MSKSKLSIVGLNIGANFVGRGWGFVSVYIFIPIYLKYLGMEAFGLVGFYSTILSIALLADFGLAATLSREFARLSPLSGTTVEMRNLLRTYELVYLPVALIVSITVWALAPYIVKHWLNIGMINVEDATIAIQLMGIAIALQLPNGMYNGGLSGLQRQVAMNIVQISWSLFRGLGVIVVFIIFSPSIRAFALWQLISNLLFCVITRAYLWHSMPKNGIKGQFSTNAILTTWKYAISMAIMALFSTILTQIDKIIISNVLPISLVGKYSIAAAVGSVPMMLANPIGIAVFPRFSEYIAKKNYNTLRESYHKTAQLVSFAVLPGALVIIMYAEQIIYLWTGSSALAIEIGSVASLLLVGQMMQALTVIPFYYALSHGETKLFLKIQIISVIVMIPLQIILVQDLGLIGGAVAWLLMNIITLPVYMWLLHRQYLKGDLLKWIIYDIGMPLMCSLVLVKIIHMLTSFGNGRIQILISIVLVWILSCLITVLTLPLLRIELKKYLNLGNKNFRF